MLVIVTMLLTFFVRDESKEATSVPVSAVEST